MPARSTRARKPRAQKGGSLRSVATNLGRRLHSGATWIVQNPQTALRQADQARQGFRNARLAATKFVGGPEVREAVAHGGVNAVERYVPIRDAFNSAHKYLDPIGFGRAHQRPRYN